VSVEGDHVENDDRNRDSECREDSNRWESREDLVFYRDSNSLCRVESLALQ
jgi:hypothetical protein